MPFENEMPFPDDVPFEDGFSRALRLAVDTETPPAADAVALAARRRGVRRRRRRRIVAGAVTVALTATAAVLLVQLRPVTGEADRSPTGTATTTGVRPSSSGSPSASGSAVPVTGDRMLELLRSRLPAGSALSAPMGLDADRSGGRWPQAMAGYTITDAAGSGGVTVTVMRGAPTDPARADVCPPPTGHGAPTCTGTARPDGSYLWINRPAAAVGGEQLWQVVLQKADGVRVTAAASNIPGPGIPADGPLRNGPVLETSQLSAIALDPVWLQVADALTAPK